MFRAAPLAAGFALLMALTGCGASDEEQASEAVAAGLMKAGDETLTFTQEQADCVGDGFVDDIGVDKLQEYGIITDDLQASDAPINAKLSSDDADSAAAVMVDCVDATKLFKESMLRGQDLSADAIACIEGALNDEMLEKFLAASFAQDGAAASEATAPLQECVAD